MLIVAVASASSIAVINGSSAGLLEDTQTLNAKNLASPFS
jgi:hypothetical protein